MVGYYAFHSLYLLQNMPPLNVLPTNFLQECIYFEASIGNKKCGFILLYRTPNQSQDKIYDFLTNLEMNLDDSFNSNSFLTTGIGDFNAKSNKWSKGDRSTIEGSKIDFLTSKFGLSQIIKEPTHILENSSSCIDLIFTTQPNMGMLSLILMLMPKCPFFLTLS